MAKFLIEIETPKKLCVWQDGDIETEEKAFEKLGKEEVLKYQQKTLDKFNSYVGSHLIELIEDYGEFSDGMGGIINMENDPDLEELGIKVKVVEQK